MIVYKVVEKQTRHCSNWTLFKDSYIRESDQYEMGLRFKKKNPLYFPRYFKGKVIKAAPNSSGILCFASLSNAKKFQRAYITLQRKAIIIEVEGIGKRIDPWEVLLCGSCGVLNGLLRINKYINPFDSIHTPSGTIGFPAVKVLT